MRVQHTQNIKKIYHLHSTTQNENCEFILFNQSTKIKK